MEQEATDELIGRERHGLVSNPFFGAVVLPLEGNALFVQIDQPAVGDCNPVGVAGEISQYGLGSGKGALGVDDPLALAQGLEPIGEVLGISEPGVFAEEL